MKELTLEVRANPETEMPPVACVKGPGHKRRWVGIMFGIFCQQIGFVGAI